MGGDEARHDGGRSAVSPVEAEAAKNMDEAEETLRRQILSPTKNWRATRRIHD
jgi:hypothetical protein